MDNRTTSKPDPFARLDDLVFSSSGESSGTSSNWQQSDSQSIGEIEVDSPIKSKEVMTTACIVTPHCKTPFGYGQISIEGKTTQHHRVVYCNAHKLLLSSITGSVIRHTCDNPSCINPSHLLIGTHKDNAADKVARGRAKGREVSLTKEQVASIRVSSGKHEALAKAFNVSTYTISNVLRRLGAYK